MMGLTVARPGFTSAAAPAPAKIFDAAVLSANVDIDAGCTSHLIAHHLMSDTPSGHVVLVGLIGGVEVPFHGDGTNIKSSNGSSNYMSLFKYVPRSCRIKLTRASGAHDVYLEDLAE